MKITISWSPVPLKVYALTWSRHGQIDTVLNDMTSLSVIENDNLTDIYEHECNISSYNLDDFSMMPKSFDSRVIVLMWKPLAEAGIWPALREFDGNALIKFKQLRMMHGHIETNFN